MQPSSPENLTPHPALDLPIIILTPEESVAAHIRTVVAAQGGRAVEVATPAAFVDAMDRDNPVLALVDLLTPGEWAAAIARCKLRPHTQAIPIYAFGDASDSVLRRKARRSGADAFWPRMKLWSGLPALVDHHLRPPVFYPEGWNDALPHQAQVGIVEFNAGRFFEQHEHLEEAWRAESRPIRAMYQGILQVGLAFLQLQRGNWIGALKMFRRGLPRLRDLPAVCQGVQIEHFRAAAEAIHREVTQLGPKRLDDFDQSRFPQIEFIAAEELAQTARVETDKREMRSS